MKTYSKIIYQSETDHQLFCEVCTKDAPVLYRMPCDDLADVSLDMCALCSLKEASSSELGGYRNEHV